MSLANHDNGIERVLRETLGDEGSDQPLPLDEPARRSMVQAMERAHWHAGGRPAPWRAVLGGLALVLAAVLTALWFLGLDLVELGRLLLPPDAGAEATGATPSSRPWLALLLPVVLAFSGLLLILPRSPSPSPDVAQRGPS